jgi:outer membrane protein OmpA-like peptidoglycan-associated protein
MIRLFLTAALLLRAAASWGETPLFKAFFEQRELVAAVLFENGSSRLNKMAESELQAMLPRIREADCEARLIRIEGFSGREGAAEDNFRLSLNRANSVALFLEKQGVPCLVGVNGYGDLHAGQNGAVSDLRVEIAAYPKMFIFDFDSAREVAAKGGKQP